MVAAQEKAKKAEAEKLAKKSKGKNRGCNSNVGKGKGPANAAREGNRDFADELIDISGQFFPMDYEVYQAMLPFLDKVPVD